jgi:hypothetical protein
MKRNPIPQAAQPATLQDVIDRLAAHDMPSPNRARDQGIERKSAPHRALADRLPQCQRLDARLHAHVMIF